MKNILFVVLVMVSACSKSGGGSSSTQPEKRTPSQTETNPQTSTPLKDIVNETDSVIRPSEEDPRIILVGPSKHDRIIISNARGFNANIGFCKELEMFHEMTARADQKKEEIMKTRERIVQLTKDKAPEHEIETLKFNLRILESSLKRTLTTISTLEGTYLKQGAVVDVEWISGWEENLTRLQKANPEYTFERTASPAQVPLTLNSQGLSSYATTKLVMNFMQTFRISELEDGSYSQEDMQDASYRYSAYATLFSACPLSKQPGSKIDVVVTYALGD